MYPTRMIWVKTSLFFESVDKVSTLSSSINVIWVGTEEFRLIKTTILPDLVGATVELVEGDNAIS